MVIDPVHKNEGEVKTDLYCHNCSKNFIALIDYSINGNHVIECAWCGHEHCRVITDGYITDDRWDSRNNDKLPAKPRRTWKSNVIQARTSMASQLLRERWLGG